MIIGLCGLQGSGKDTIANFLVNNYNFTRISFASILKDVVAVMFGWERKLLEGITTESRLWRDTKDIWWSEKLKKDITPRKILQEIGTDLFRNNYNPNIWIYCFENKLRKYNYEKNIVISDCRFLNEINMIKKLGGYTIEVQRNPPKWLSDIKTGKLKTIPNIHSSELELIKIKHDFVIKNNKTLFLLEKKIILFMKQLLD